MREARYWTVAWVASALFLNSCVVVPTRDGAAAIDVNAVITRVKCDLKNIVLQKANTTLADGSRPFLFLRSWAAKVHLTVAIDASSSINPGASITEPLHIVNNVAQSFTLGVGGGLTTEAIRQEDVEFLVSFPDIDREFRNGSMREFYERCPSEPGVLLQSDLGLDRLIESALKPVENGVLRPGHNVGPGAGAPPPIPTPDLPRLAAVKKEDEQAHHKQFGNASFIDLKKASPKSDKLGQVLSGFFDVKPEFQGMDAKQLQQNSTAPEKSDLEKAEAEKAKIARTLLANSTEATELETKTQAIINNIVKPRYAIAGGSFDQSCLGPVSEAQFEALAQSANLSAFVVQIDNAKDVDASNRALGRARDAHSAVINATNDMAGKMEVCAQRTSEINKEKKAAGPPVYDPIAGITETVYFYITLTGSITPTWKLVRVTAPIAGTFLSGMRKDTNTLILTMGRPIAGPNGAPTATTAMDNQILYAILGQSLNIVRP